MDIFVYTRQFRNEAIKAGLKEEEISVLLHYAGELNSRGLPIVYDQIHLSLLLGYDYEFLIAACNDSSLFYKHYEIPKKSGGYRSIDEPLPSLKEIQNWILTDILQPASRTMVSPVAKAFISGKSIRENARFHKRKRTVVALDITDFFSSIGFGAVFGIFRAMGYSKPVCVMLSRLCTLHGKLPQGAPTSPMLSNLFFKKTDDNIFHYCRERGIMYTRYADDLVFSGNELKPQHLISFVKMLLSSRQLTLNDKKTKVMGRGTRQSVTGVIVNDKMQVAREYRDKIRQEVYYCIKYGEYSHFERIRDELPKWINSPNLYLRHLLGKVYYVLQINPNDMQFVKYKDWLKGKMKVC